MSVCHIPVFQQTANPIEIPNIVQIWYPWLLSSCLYFLWWKVICLSELQAKELVLVSYMWLLVHYVQKVSGLEL
jgi:hypothetical protein